MRGFQFPFASLEDKRNFVNSLQYWKIRAKVFDRLPSAERRQEISKFASAQLFEQKVLEFPAADQPLLICIVRNAAHEIRNFLHHYRKLGVKRFAIVDDDSGDGTDSILNSQPDVDLFTSNFRFGGGVDLHWRQLLIRRYGLNRWYLSVDSDEYLVYDESETRPVTDMIRELEQRGEKHLLAIMLDIYPDGLLRDVRQFSSESSPPWSECPLLDGTGYFIKGDKRGMTIRGGPRFRLFRNIGRLNKYPLLYADNSTMFPGCGNHYVFPYQENFDPVRGVLLHNKFGYDFFNRVEKAAKLGRHSNGSRFYKEMLTDERYSTDLDLRYDGSIEFGSSRQLVESGFMEPASG